MEESNAVRFRALAWMLYKSREVGKKEVVFVEGTPTEQLRVSSTADQVIQDTFSEKVCCCKNSPGRRKHKLEERMISEDELNEIWKGRVE